MCGLTTATLAGNTPLVGTGAWSIVSGLGGTVTTPANPVSTFTGIAGTAYVLRWTISNGPCTASTDDVNITFSQAPAAPAVGTITQPTCAVPTGSVLLTGLPSGNWTINPGSIAGSGPSTIISGLAANTYNYTVTNAAGCTSLASADVVIYSGQYSISGRVKYAGMVTSGPVYDQMKYNIDSMVVVLKDCQNIEIARYTTKTDGFYFFTNLPNGDYVLNTYRETPYGSLANGINSNDVTKIKRYITAAAGYTYKPFYLLAADVDKNGSVNSNDVVKIKRKITNPDNNTYFNYGNWIGFDTTVQINYSSKHVDLKTIAYGDYDASSNSYKGGTSWTQSQTTIPQISTSLVTNITQTSAATGGNITDDGGSLVSERGVCWSTNPNPTITNNKVMSGSGPGIFISIITGLASGNTYYVRAYAINNSGIAYGNQLIFPTN
jgi:hypothetical protein